MEEYLEEEYVIEAKQPEIIVCSACLSSDRDLYSINNVKELTEIYQLIMYDFEGEKSANMYDEEVYVCWECQALMERFHKFKWQVRRAQDYIQGLANGTIIESLDHTYTSRCLSSLEIVNRTEYDRSYIDVSDQRTERNILSIISTEKPIPVEWKPVLAPKMELGTNNKPKIIHSTESQVKSDIFSDNFISNQGKSEMIGTKLNSQGPKPLLLTPMIIYRGNNSNTSLNNTSVTNNKKNTSKINKIDTHYTTEHLTENEMYKSRELCKQKPEYLHARYKCILCVIALDSQELLEEHFMTTHNAKEGQIACQICHKCIDESLLSDHTYEHYFRYMCKHCAHVEYSVQNIRRHVKTHSRSQQGVKAFKSKRKRSDSESSDMSEEFPVAGVKRVKDSYPCPVCDMVFKLARLRRTHIDRHHREGITCDYCKRRFVNKTTLIEHHRLFCPVLHPGPPPEEECPICHKMVKVVYLKEHIRRHKNKKTYECKECDKTFSHYSNYKGHFKYSRVHATGFKYKCPMCEKGYSSKGIMQDHFNYQHLGKTSHKCHICDKPLATRRCVIQHMRRVHEELDDSIPVRHVCLFCGKEFKRKTQLREHTSIHTGERALSCDICGATFRHASALYTHRRRVHNQRTIMT